VDEIVKRYAAEITAFVPLPSAASFVVGLVVLYLADNSPSIYAGFLSVPFREVWFLRDIVLSLSLWQVSVIAAISLLAPAIVRFVARKLLRKGAQAIASEVRSAYAAAVASQGSSAASARLEAAKEWSARRSARVWTYFKISSFLVAVSASSALSFRAVDLAISVAIAMLALAMTFQFSRYFLQAYIPTRVFQDASLGLLEPRLFDDIE